MAELVESLLIKTNEEFQLLTREPAETLWKISQSRKDRGLRAHGIKMVKSCHDMALSYDDDLRSPYIRELQVAGFDTEQVWQQLQLQADAASRAVIERLSTENIEDKAFTFFSEAKSSHKDNVVAAKKKKQKTENTKSRSGDANSQFIKNLSHEADANLDIAGQSDLDEDDDDNNVELNSDEEFEKIKARIKSREEEDDLFGSGDDTLFKADDDDDDGGDSDLDEEVHDDDKEDEEDAGQRNKPRHSQGKKKSEVDDKFFKLSDMEAFLDKEDKREENKKDNEKDEDEDDIDMFASDEDETARNVKYSAFFDPLADGDMPFNVNDTGDGADDRADDDGADDGADDDEDDRAEELPSKGRKKVHFKKETFTEDLVNETEREANLSGHEKRQERLRKTVAALEEEILQPKPWQMMGEVGSRDRTENSLLELHLQTDVTAAGVPEVTEELTKSVEEIISQRIKDKAFDDNVRQVKKTEEAFELKTKKTVNDEKSQLTLAEVFEQEYKKKITHPKEEDADNAKHLEIQNLMKTLFTKLDALASWHYTPVQAMPDIKVRSNLPAIEMEEATPLTMAGEGVLAPEEVQAKKKREVKGKTERMKEDKSRERREKKAAKRRKATEREQQVKAVEKAKPGLGNKYAKERALKQLQREAKGNLEVVEGKRSEKLTSSKAFFTSLQEEVTTQIKAKMASTGKKKKSKELSSDKLLL